MTRLHRHQFLLLAIILSLATGLRIWRLTKGDLWYDELFTLHTTLGPVREVLKRAFDEVHPPLYFLLLRGWLEILGVSIWSVRGFSLLFGVACIFAAFQFCKQYHGKLAAFLVAIAMGTSPLLAHYSQEARNYAMLNFLTICQAAILWRTIENGRFRNYLLLIILSAFGVLTHYYYLFVIAAEMVFISALFASSKISKQKIGTPSGNMILALATICAAALPGALMALVQMRGKDNEAMLAWLPRPEWIDLAKGFFNTPSLGAGDQISIIPVLVIFGIWLVALLSLANTPSPSRWIALFSFFVYAAFLVGTFFVSRWWVPCYMPTRYAVIALPFFVCGCGAMLATKKYQKIGFSLFLLLIICNLWGIFTHAVPDLRPQTASLVAAMHNYLHGKGDIIYCNYRMDQSFLNFHFPQANLIEMDQMEDSNPKARIIYFENREARFGFENPHLMGKYAVKQAAQSVDLIATAENYAAYSIQGLDINALKTAWAHKDYLARPGADERNWNVFLGAEKPIFDKRRSEFGRFQIDSETGIQFRRFISTSARLNFSGDSPNLFSGEGEFHIALGVDPATGFESIPIHFEIFADRESILRGTLPIEGAYRDYLIPVQLSPPRNFMELRLSSQPGSGKGLDACLFYWFGFTGKSPEN